MIWFGLTWFWFDLIWLHLIWEAECPLDKLQSHCRKGYSNKQPLTITLAHCYNLYKQHLLPRQRVKRLLQWEARSRGMCHHLHLWLGVKSHNDHDNTKPADLRNKSLLLTMTTGASCAKACLDFVLKSGVRSNPSMCTQINSDVWKCVYVWIQAHLLFTPQSTWNWVHFWVPVSSLATPSNTYANEYTKVGIPLSAP